MNNKKKFSLKGQFLIAMPRLFDPNFRNTVICMLEHTEKGSMGIIVNRVDPNLSADAIFKQLEISYLPGTASIPIHRGGPMHIDQIFVLHGPPLQWRKSLIITPWLSLSNTIDILKAIGIEKEPDYFIISLGCTVWGPGCLETEIKKNVWLTCPVFKDIIFDIPVNTRWKEAIKKLGISPEFLSGMAGHA